MSRWCDIAQTSAYSTHCVSKEPSQSSSSYPPYCPASACGRQLRYRADDVIETGSSRRLEDEDVVGAQLIEPDAFGRRGEKTPQSLDGCGNFVLGPALREIGTNPFRLRPQARHRIMDAAVGEHGVNRHAAAWIEAVRVGECDQPRRRFGRLSGGEAHPAVQQECPLVVVPRLADTSFDT